MIKLNVNTIQLIQVERDITWYEIAKMTKIRLPRLNELFLDEKVRASDVEKMLKAFPELRFEDLFIIE